MRGKIVKCSSPEYWYSSMVGNEFDVDTEAVYEADEKGNLSGPSPTYSDTSGIMRIFYKEKDQNRYIDKKDFIEISYIRNKKIDEIIDN